VELSFYHYIFIKKILNKKNYEYKFFFGSQARFSKGAPSLAVARPNHGWLGCVPSFGHTQENYHHHWAHPRK
jgi:hypothetical protein